EAAPEVRRGRVGAGSRRWRPAGADFQEALRPRRINPRVASAAPERIREGRPVARAVSQPPAGARKDGTKDSASPAKSMICLERWLGRQDSNLGSRDQNPLPYRLATPQRRSL